MKDDNIFEKSTTTNDEVITAGKYFSKIAKSKGKYFNNIHDPIIIVQENTSTSKSSSSSSSISSSKYCFRVIENIKVQNETIPVSYKYEMTVSDPISSSNVIDYKNMSNSRINSDLVEIETNMTNYLVEHFCQSNQTRNVLGLSSNPSDYIYNDKGKAIYLLFKIFELKFMI